MTDRSSAKQRAILEAALQCFSRHGVEATTIDMIREASGASVGSLYHRFGNKEGIAAEVYIEGLRDFRRRLNEQLDAATTLEAATHTVVYANIDWITAHPDWARFVFNHRVVLSRADREAAFSAEVAEANRALWQKISTLPGFEALPPWPPQLFRSLISGPVHDYARQWLDGRCNTAPTELREAFAAAAWRAINPGT